MHIQLTDICEAMKFNSAILSYGFLFGVSNSSFMTRIKTVLNSLETVLKYFLSKLSRIFFNGKK